MLLGSDACQVYVYACSFCLCRRGADFIRTHPEFGETFQSWTLYEAAPGAYNVFQKKWHMLSGPDGVTQNLGEAVDFLHPRLQNSGVLQCILFVINSVTTALFDGVKPDDMRMLLLEATKLCVAWLHAYRCHTESACSIV